MVVVHAGWTRGVGGARWAVDARWWTRAGVSRLLNRRSREQLDAAEEQDEFALFADRLNDAAINPQRPRRPPTLRHQLAPLESENRHDFVRDVDMGQLYAWANCT